MKMRREWRRLGGRGMGACFEERWGGREGLLLSVWFVSEHCGSNFLCVVFSVHFRFKFVIKPFFVLILLLACVDRSLCRDFWDLSIPGNYEFLYLLAM